MTFEHIVKKFGYKLRTEGYYLFREEDGYINITYPYKDNSGFGFHKNFYSGLRNPHFNDSKYGDYVNFLGFKCHMSISTISYNTENINEFYNFMLSFRNIERLKLNKKLKKISRI